ncbi:hypothetical protein G6F57_019618 [Rhizopus arrhizus]|nr:hypothetical protein G6F57_019618 [Rhizopus arrhizus]
MAEGRGQAAAGERPAAHAGAAHTGAGILDLAAGARQHPGEHFADQGAGGDQGQRLGPRRAEPAGPGDSRPGARRGRRGECLHRPRRRVAATADRDRP